MRSFKKKHRKSTVVAPNYKDLQKQADRILETWARGRWQGMPNTDIRVSGGDDSGIPADDKQVELCFKQAEKWEERDRLIAQDWWGEEPKKRNKSAIARLYGISSKRVDSRLTWMNDQIIENCVKNVNIYP